MYFEKISYDDFSISLKSIKEISDTDIKEIYNNIKMPAQIKEGLACYNIFSPFKFNISPKKNIIIPTGIRVDKIEKDMGLFVFPKDELNDDISFNNIINIIDPVSLNNKNNGHIILDLSYSDISKENNITYSIKENDGITKDDTITINSNDVLCQAAFIYW